MGLVNIPRTGWINRGIPGIFAEDDFTHPLIVDKGNICVASRYDFDLDRVSIMGFIHEFPEFLYGDKVSREVSFLEKDIAETKVIGDVCGRPSELGYLFLLWNGFNHQLNEGKKIVFMSTKSRIAPLLLPIGII